MALTQKEISQLYVALLNRAADAGGVEFWQDQASLAEAAQAMIDSQAGTPFYPEDNRAFVEQIYENTVGLEGQEDADIQYWVDLLASGEYSRGELVAHMVNSIMDSEYEGTPYQESFVSRVAVSEYVAGLNLAGMSPEELVAATTFDEDGLGVVRTEADTASAKEKAGELEAVDNTSLTEGLTALDKASTDKAGFAKDLDLTEFGPGEKATHDVSDLAGNASNVVTGTNGIYTVSAGSVGSALNTPDGGFAARTTAVQDQLIEDQKTALNSAYSSAVAKAEKNTVSLVESVVAAVDSAEQANVELGTATQTRLAGKGAFDAINGALKFEGTATNGGGNLKQGISAGANDIASGDIFVFEGKVYQATGAVTAAGLANATPTNATLVAQNKNGAWVLEDNATAKALKGLTDALAANDTFDAATTKVANAEKALASAIEQVYLNENGGFEIKLSGSNDLYAELVNKGVIDPAANPGEYDIDLDLPVDIWKTEADKKAGAGSAGVIQEFTVQLTGSTPKSSDTIVFDGVTITLSADAFPNTALDNATVAGQNGSNTFAAAEGTSGVKWAITSDGSGKLTFKADAPAANVDITGVTVNKVGVSSDIDGSATEVKAGVAVGVGAGESESKDASASDKVYFAQQAIEDFNDLVDIFESAREIRDELVKLDTAIKDATEWFDDNGYITPKLLDGSGPAEVATAKNDIYMISDLIKSTSFVSDSIDNFGDKGQDFLFLGKEYVFTALEAGKTISSAGLGDATKLEIFYQETSSGDLKLYIEKEAFAGSANGNADIVEVTLTGVAFEDVTLEGSFITAGEIA